MDVAYTGYRPGALGVVCALHAEAQAINLGFGQAFESKVAREELDLSAIFSHYTELRGYRSRYRLRKHTVEPVFGQIKECRGLRRFLHRGLEKVSAEWQMLCTAHNQLKLAAARA